MVVRKNAAPVFGAPPDEVPRHNAPDEAIPPSHGCIPYERQLAENPRWALSEGSRHFEENSAVFQALEKISRRLDELGVEYAVVGGMALFQHGYRRFTEDVDILVTPKDLRTIHQRLEGRGYRPPHPHSKHLRDTELGVRIEFLTSGEYPGDGKPKPVQFPDPEGATVERDGIKFLSLEKLIELKLASGMTGVGRLRDHSDVLELIKLIGLPRDYSRHLDPYVREKYEELWAQAVRRYVTLWRNERLTAGATSIQEMASRLRDAAELLEAMQRDGVELQSLDSVRDDCVFLTTTDPEVARKYDMVEETEFWDEAAEASEADQD
ncbi:MAG: nucleotidyltransferase family protein [Armatimonadota bacterium]